MRKRRSGILMHISSLPGPYGIGDFGPTAYRFVDFLHDSGQSIWQILPLSVTSLIIGNSPYSSPSAFALNPLFVSPELLVDDGFLAADDVVPPDAFASIPQVDYKLVTSYKEKLLMDAYKCFQANLLCQEQFNDFVAENRCWLDNYSCFMVLKKLNKGVTWDQWAKPFRDRHEGFINIIRSSYKDKLGYHKFVQFILHKQWQQLRQYCRSKKVSVVGDIPIYVEHDSADVWEHRELFKLNRLLRPKFIAGTPPDFFCKTGQRWGNPVYDWNSLRKQHYQWWINRFKHNLNLFDFVRMDHFRGFVKYWEISSKHKTAKNGCWKDVPTYDFFDTVFSQIDRNKIIAEDLGDITDDVVEAISHYKLPGMKVLVFAFDDDMETNIHLPHNFPENSLVYTATHDTNTIVGWFEYELNRADKKKFADYYTSFTRQPFNTAHVNWACIDLALKSKANMAILSMQDILGLDDEARMNYPGKPKGNWVWRCTASAFSSQLAGKLWESTSLAGRLYVYNHSSC